MRCGSACAIATACVLLVCGITVVVIGPMHTNILDEGLDYACTSISKQRQCLAMVASQAVRDAANTEMKAECAKTADATKCEAEVTKELKDVDKTIQDALPSNKDIYNGCWILIKQETFKCKCPPVNANDLTMPKHEDCLCAGTGYKAVLEAFKMALIAVGVVGIFVCIMVAALGVASTKNSSILVAYSCCSVLFSFAFIGIGCVFFIIAMLSTGQVDVGDPNAQLLLKDCPTWSARNLKTGSDFDKCLKKATCDTVKFWQGKFQTVGFGIGIPYFLAGILMFVAMYACCCCKQHFGEQEDSSPVEFTATAASQMQGQEQDDFPGAEFYPAPGKNKPKPQAMGYPGGQDPQNQGAGLYPTAY